MEQIYNPTDMFALIMQPAFCVENGIITRVNQTAQQYLVEVGTPVAELLATGTDEYLTFQGGSLYLTINTADHLYGASVTRIGEQDIFLLESQSESAELHAMALAARELREPLANIMAVADRLMPKLFGQEDPHTLQQIGQINQGLYQMLRLISNMSDADRYGKNTDFPRETFDISAVFDELLSSAATIVTQAGYDLRFVGLAKPVYGLINRELLERAVYNLISNAIKFSEKGTSLKAKLTRNGNKLYFTVEDSGSGIASDQRGTMFFRFLRKPGIEDGRYGIGLGMVLVRAAATAHNGTVLVEQIPSGGTRVTMSFTLAQNKTSVLGSHIFTIDYAGERDHGLIELSESRPVSSFIKNG